MVKDGLDEVCTKGERRSYTGDRQNGRGQCRILHAAARRETQARKHGRAGGNEIRIAGPQVRFREQYIRSSGQKLRGEPCRNCGLAQRVQRLSLYVEAFWCSPQQYRQRRARLNFNLLQIRYGNLCNVEGRLLRSQVNSACDLGIK